ncbi:MAG: ribosome maturation factor RimP [Francisellaceae bacterium]|jgi:ribosome maturation factor RimP
MLNEETISQLKAEIELLGYVLWGLETQGGQNNALVVQVFVEKDGGITLDNCQEVGRHLGAFIEVEEIITSKYTLEVSSPGINRRIFNLNQCIGLESKFFKFKLIDDIDGRKSFKAELIKVDMDKGSLEFNYEGDEMVVSYDNIDKMNLFYKW